MRTTHEYSLLFRLVAKIGRYYLLSLVGLVITWLVSNSLGIADVFTALFPFLWAIVWRFTVLLLCSIMAAVITESLRS
jgi:hypothetical protein